jgi:hypothetical protein
MNKAVKRVLSRLNPDLYADLGIVLESLKIQGPTPGQNLFEIDDFLLGSKVAAVVKSTGNQTAGNG